MSRNPYPQC